MFPAAKDVVKRWVNEAQEAVNAKSSGSFFSGNSGASSYLGGWGSSSSNTQSGYQAISSTSYITQYHALGLLYLIRQQDRMAVTKMIQQLGGGKTGSGTVLKNPMALVMLIRYAAKVMEEDPKCVAVMSTHICCLIEPTIILACNARFWNSSKDGSGTRAIWSTSKRPVSFVR